MNVNINKDELIADAVGIIKALDHIERFYIRNTISPDDYTKECSALITQFRAVITALDTSIDQFTTTYATLVGRNVVAIHRLKAGIPVTLECQMVPKFVTCDVTKGYLDAKTAAEITQHFITTMDYLRLKLCSVDVILPLLMDIKYSLCKIPVLTPSSTACSNVNKWVNNLNSKKATDELSDDECNQMSLDIEIAYSNFYNILSNPACGKD